MTLKWMVLIAGKEPALSVARIIRGELIVINTCLFTTFSRLLIADPFGLFGSWCGLDVGLVLGMRDLRDAHGKTSLKTRHGVHPCSTCVA